MSFVAVVSVLCIITFTTLGILGQTFTTNLVSAGIMIIIIVVYFVAASKLSAVLKDGNEAGIRIIKLTRQVATVLVCNAVVQGLFSILSRRGNDLIALQIFISNFLFTVFLSAGVLLLLHFILFLLFLLFLLSLLSLQRRVIIIVVVDGGSCIGA